MAYDYVEIVIDTEEALRYAREKLGALQGGKARMAVRNAINKTAKEVKKIDERAAKRTFTDKSDLNALEFQKATTANLEALLKDKGGSVSITHFTWRNGIRGVTALINRNNGYKKMTLNGNSAFYNGISVFVREGPERLPIKKVKSLSSPSAHGAPDVWQKETEQQGQELFYENLENEIVRILNLI